jgi:hypothetical protein
MSTYRLVTSMAEQVLKQRLFLSKPFITEFALIPNFQMRHLFVYIQRTMLNIGVWAQIASERTLSHMSDLVRGQTVLGLVLLGTNFTSVHLQIGAVRDHVIFDLHKSREFTVAQVTLINTFFVQLFVVF